MFRTPVGMTGNIATEPEYSTTHDGKTVARFRLATQENQYVDGEWQRSDAVFHNVSAFGKVAQAVQRTFAKGDRVAVVGTLKMESYIDDQGKKRQGTTIIADTVAADPLFTPVTVDRGPGNPAPTAQVQQEANVGPASQQTDPYNHMSTAPQYNPVMDAQRSWQAQMGM